jgi:hypothetical protein
MDHLITSEMPLGELEPNVTPLTHVLSRFIFTSLKRGELSTQVILQQVVELAIKERNRAVLVAKEDLESAPPPERANTEEWDETDVNQ